MADLPVDLREALGRHLVGSPTDHLRASVERLGEAYRSGNTPTAPILSSTTDVAAYAAYRMPATFAAMRRALAALPIAFAPRSQLDLGGGTGAAAWAAAERFGSIDEITVVDQVGGALTLGATLARNASSSAVRQARWVTEQLDAVASAALPPVDLVTVSYLLGELTPHAQRLVVDRAAAAGSVAVFVEPGTPAGYARILAARAHLIASGAKIVAPCPHQAGCPLAAGDWCHFGARVNRSALHRRVKDGELSYEDEKFAYLAAVSPAALPFWPDATSGYARIVRRPVRRKGMISLRVCRPDGTAGEQIVSKRHTGVYRSAREAEWGDELAPPA